MRKLRTDVGYARGLLDRQGFRFKGMPKSRKKRRKINRRSLSYNHVHQFMDMPLLPTDEQVVAKIMDDAMKRQVNYFFSNRRLEIMTNPNRPSDLRSHDDPEFWTDKYKP